MYCQRQQMGDFGRNIFTPVVRTVKRISKVARTPVTVLRKVSQGNIKGATKDIIDLHNPAVIVAKAVSGKENIINMARIASPLSVVNISDKKLRKKAAIGYAAAAVVATAVFTGAGAGATGELTKAEKVASIASTAAGLAKKKRDNDEIDPFAADAEYAAAENAASKNKYLAGMITPQNILLFMGLSGLTVAGYLLFNKPMKR